MWLDDGQKHSVSAALCWLSNKVAERCFVFGREVYEANQTVASQKEMVLI